MPQVIESRLTGGPLLKNTTGRIEVTVYVDGTATAADSGTPTITVTRSDGTALATAQNVTTSVAGVLYYDLTPAQCNRLDTLTAEITGTWSAGTQVFTHTVEVRGAHLFTVAEARAFDAAALASTSTYPTGAILDERERIAAVLEEWTGISWIPRHERVTLPGTGSPDLALPHRFVTQVIAATIGTTSVSTTDITIKETPGVLTYEAASGWTKPQASNPQNVTVEYVHGRDPRYTGADRIALLLLRDRLVKSDIPESALSVAGEYGSISLVQPGGPMRNVSRIPEVNAWVALHRIEAPVA